LKRIVYFTNYLNWNLNWWCLVFFDLDTNKPLAGVSGTYGYGSGGIFDIINTELSLIISGIYFVSLVAIFLLHRKHNLKDKINPTHFQDSA